MTKNSRGRLTKFKINPGLYNPYKPGFGHYYNVHIFDTRENMRNFSNTIRKEEYPDKIYEAKVIPYWRVKELPDGDYIVAPKVGDVLFHQKRLEVRIVSHECVHMATSFLRILNNYDLKLRSQIDENEENLAYTIGNCCDQIYKKINQLGLFN